MDAGTQQQYADTFHGLHRKGGPLIMFNAWAVATVVAHEYDNLPAQLTAYGLASLVSLSRFTGQRHYLSDIFVGGAIGYGIGRYVYRAHHNTALDASVANQGNKWRPAVSPVYSRANREYGLTLTWGL